ncbi:DUF1152 domain-containing protein [Niveibacterium sp. 24ML]|uniref:DUF1152 domain-containing protein n=1 Tax=Niveibacterium sp. 24ML TaxID=2985512 RepID=UPI002270F0F1|nr:DUF1152 domain-containing protein [Niveibacterium sp. 24ML]MCX9156329.1 DUF1152 domain-containing protein [Niveibacterium sp. 24ML]
MQIPFFEAIANSRTILLAGAGGGFDIASGIPLYTYLRRLGKKVVLANLSFTALSFTDCQAIIPGVYEVTAESGDVPYFPEKYILEWIRDQGETPAMYAFSNKLGVRPLAEGYAALIQAHAIDTLVMVDGGTDSLMFGDESGVGTIIEDACSIVAASLQRMPLSFLVAVGFGVEHFHKLDHHACLENIATLIKSDAYLGAVSLTKEMPDGESYLKLVAYLNSRQPTHMSIVTNSLASAMKGEFGDFHPTPRTGNSEQFINPLMGLLWFFTLEGIASRITFRPEIEDSRTMDEVAKGFTRYRNMTQRRPLKKIPL